jgi:hypothetical protein
MIKQHIVRVVVRVGIAALIGMGVATSGPETSFANCGGHCQAGKMCGDLVSRKGVKGDQKREEYQKCMRDPNSYK